MVMKARGRLPLLGGVEGWNGAHCRISTGVLGRLAASRSERMFLACSILMMAPFALVGSME